MKRLFQISHKTEQNDDIEWKNRGM